MHEIEEVKLTVIPNLAASAETSAGNISLKNCRTLAVTCRVTYNASASSGVTVKLYYVHKEIGEDTVTFTTFTPTITAGARVQRTVLIDAPETGSFVVKVKNDSSSYAATDVEVGYSIQRWK